jgi:CRP-like cAMP-binding protein
MMTGEPRGATVKAASALECYVLGKHDFGEILLARQDVAEEVSAVILSRQSALQKARAKLSNEGAGEDHNTMQQLTGRIREFLLMGKTGRDTS